MKALILYKPISETATSVEEYAHSFKQQTARTLELIDIESKEGIALQELHDLVQYPVIIAVREDGSLVEIWPDRDSWPTVSELSFYAQ